MPFNWSLKDQCIIYKSQILTLSIGVRIFIAHLRHVECVCQLVRQEAVRGKISYREEEIGDCGCIYG